MRLTIWAGKSREDVAGQDTHRLPFGGRNPLLMPYHYSLTVISEPNI